ncbi:SDR family NAD(P)-dependent oxidoreductase [Microbacterium sp. NPDC076911]|uniref:SDR family NAD(P)-dependent oxidoreductase n=1 Tax=Microbacterium sp. NPDC076911 TaxID=3154958 RepID=UPI0034248D55
MPESGVASRTVILAGGTSEAGRAVARALLRCDARVIVVGRDQARLDQVADEIPGVATEACDLTDEAAVLALAQRVGPVDGVIHLVGGWRGGGGLDGQNEADYRFLEAGFTSLRHVSRAFDGDLRASTAGRMAIVSSTATSRPLAGGANYAAVKAASEAWARAVAQGFAKAARDGHTPLAAASVVFRVTSLAGFEQDLADAIVELWNAPATDINDTVVALERN